MGKRPKNWGVTPLERLKQSQDAKAGKLPEKKPKKIKIDKFAKGIVTEIGSFKIPEGGGWFTPTPGKYEYYWDESGEWNKEALQKIVWQTEIVEEPKDPLEEFTDEWYEQNKDSF